MLHNAPALLAPVAKGVVQLEIRNRCCSSPNPKTTPEEQALDTSGQPYRQIAETAPSGGSVEHFAPLRAMCMMS
jgi:hypothetical protein